MNNSIQVATPDQHSEPFGALAFRRVVFAICPTGAYCREDRCQSFFSLELIPTMRAPLEECEAAGAIRAAGGRAVVIDGPAEKLDEARFLKRVSDARPDVVIIVTTFGTLDLDLAWAGRLKDALHQIPVGLRGAPCYTHDLDILARAPSIDFCVKGEYEIVFDALARSGFAGAPGVAYRSGQSIVPAASIPRIADLDTLPLPDRSAVNSRLYKVRGLGSPQATIRVQRGCPFPCSYCLVHTVSGSQARHRSPSHIALEMKQLMKGGTTCFYLRADTFSLDKEWTLELCATLARECPGARWVTTTRADRVDDQIVHAMAGAGCYGISFGLDVASKTIAKKVNKYASVDSASSAFRACDQNGIVSLAYIMTGFLWETHETLRESEAFLKSIRPDLLTVHFAHPYPGTKYYSDVASTNATILSLRAQAEPALNSPGVSAQEVALSARRWLLQHYTRPSVIRSLVTKGTKIMLRTALAARTSRHS